VRPIGADREDARLDLAPLVAVLLEAPMELGDREQLEGGGREIVWDLGAMLVRERAHRVVGGDGFGQLARVLEFPGQQGVVVQPVDHPGTGRLQADGRDACVTVELGELSVGGGGGRSEAVHHPAGCHRAARARPRAGLALRGRRTRV
jgi:hypothetical protein